MQSFIQLVKREIYRFLSIWVQTIIGPVTTAILYQLIFGHQLASVSTGINSISYNTFIIPGLIMMQILMNSFGNASSSIISSKYNGSIIFVLMAPIRPSIIYLGYLTGSICRGVIVGLAVAIGIAYFGIAMPAHIWAVIYFLIMGASITSGLGVIAGIVSDKFEHLAGFQSFVMTPLIYLAGVFFNPSNLQGIWHTIAMLDPFLYIVEGFRYGFIGHMNSSILYASMFVLIFTLMVNSFGFYLIKTGVRIKH